MWGRRDQLPDVAMGRASSRACVWHHHPPQRWSATIQRFVRRPHTFPNFRRMVTAPEIAGRWASTQSKPPIYACLSRSVNTDWKDDFACVWFFTQCTGYWPCWRHFLPVVTLPETNQTSWILHLCLQCLLLVSRVCLVLRGSVLNLFCVKWLKGGSRKHSQ